MSSTHVSINLSSNQSINQFIYLSIDIPSVALIPSHVRTESVFCTPRDAHSVGSEDSSSVSDVESDASLPAGPRPRKLLRAGPKEPAADASDAGVGIVKPARAENRRRRRKSAPNSTSGSMIQAETLCCSADAVAELPSNLRRLAKSGAALLDVVGERTPWDGRV